MVLLGNTYLAAGNSEDIPEILAFLGKEGFDTEGNPDLYVKAYTHFGIDEARELRSRAFLRAISGRRIFIIATPDMNREAQNALLKILEEPPGDALFFFILPSPESLLPTLRSRTQMLKLEKRKEKNSDAEAFLKATPEKRLDLLKPLLEKDEDDKRDLGAILAFLAALEARLEKHPEGLPAGRHGLHTIYRARKYITDKGALVKPLLEQVALLLPRV